MSEWQDRYLAAGWDKPITGTNKHVEYHLLMFSQINEAVNNIYCLESYSLMKSL